MTHLTPTATAYRISPTRRPGPASPGSPRRSRVRVFCMALAVAACTNQGAEATLAGSDHGGADTLVVSSDPELAELAAEVLADLATRTGLGLQRPVRVEWRSREELERYLALKVEEELGQEEASNITDSYALLGLVPDTLDLRALLLSLYGEQVAGFYEPDSTALFIMEDQQEGLLRTVMAHELVHAVQDQVADLDAITDRSRGSDRLTAAQAAIEGHATLIMMEYMMEQMRGEPIDVSELPDLSSRLEPLLSMVREQYPELAAAPRVIQESLLYPYLEGAGFVLDLWTLTGGRPAPFGDYLPESTEQVDDPRRLIGETRDPPTALMLTSDVAPAYEEELGYLGTRILLEDQVGQGTPAGWDGDRFMMFRNGEEKSLVWASVWDTAVDRDAFVDALEQSGWARRMRAEVRKEARRDRPLAVITIGAAPLVQVDVLAGG